VRSGVPHHLHRDVTEYKHRQIDVMDSCWYRIYGNCELFERKTVKIWVIAGDITKKIWDGQGEFNAN
jgi:hypothetical protein